jgi:hypothetical protein
LELTTKGVLCCRFSDLQVVVALGSRHLPERSSRLARQREEKRRAMRTAKALGRKAGFGLCSKFAIVLYVVIIVMFYGIATLTISNQAAKRRIDICEKGPPPRQ